MAVPRESFRLRENPTGSLSVALARSEEEVIQCQELRYQVFAVEMGAELGCADGRDRDHFDDYCQHLIVRDNDTGRIVGTTRILLGGEATLAGSYYSQTEFDLTQVLAMPGRFMEIGRTCIHADYRTGPSLGVLWQGIWSMMTLHNVDYLIGCASIPFGDTGRYAASVISHLKERYYAPEYLRVHPKVPLPQNGMPSKVEVVVPPLLKAYVRLGAVVCGEACWDMAFNVADAFVLLDRDHLNHRYLNRFISRC